MQPTVKRVMWPGVTRDDLPDEWDTDTQIRVFRNQVCYWQLDIAERLMRGDEHAGFAALHIVSSYFEMIWQYREGRSSKGNESKAAFIEGVIWVFEDDWNWAHLDDSEQERIKKYLEVLYYDLRCGLYHSGITQAHVGISASYPALELSSNGIWCIYPLKLVLKLKQHLERYVTQLSTDSSLRANFVKRFEADHRV
jgi:hypothetical protein